MFSKTQWPAAEWRETASQNHSVVRVLWRIDDFLLHTTRGLIHHEKHKPIRKTDSAVASGPGAAPFFKRFVRCLRFAFVFVKASARFAPEHLATAQREKRSGNVITPSVGFLKGIANINSDIDANFIDQSQRSHRHSPCHKRIVDLVRVQSAFKKLRGIEQIRKQHAVNQKTRAVAHNHREFSDLSHKGETPLPRLL